jgi:hypothetical protein
LPVSFRSSRSSRPSNPPESQGPTPGPAPRSHGRTLSWFEKSDVPSRKPLELNALGFVPGAAPLVRSAAAHLGGLWGVSREDQRLHGFLNALKADSNGLHPTRHHEEREVRRQLVEAFEVLPPQYETRVLELARELGAVPCRDTRAALVVRALAEATTFKLLSLEDALKAVGPLPPKSLGAMMLLGQSRWTEVTARCSALSATGLDVPALMGSLRKAHGDERAWALLLSQSPRALQYAGQPFSRASSEAQRAVLELCEQLGDAPAEDLRALGTLAQLSKPGELKAQLKAWLESGEFPGRDGLKGALELGQRNGWEATRLGQQVVTLAGGSAEQLESTRQLLEWTGSEPSAATREALAKVAPERWVKLTRVLRELGIEQPSMAAANGQEALVRLHAERPPQGALQSLSETFVKTGTPPSRRAELVLQNVIQAPEPELVLKHLNRCREHRIELLELLQTEGPQRAWQLLHAVESFKRDQMIPAEHFRMVQIFAGLPHWLRDNLQHGIEQANQSPTFQRLMIPVAMARIEAVAARIRARNIDARIAGNAENVMDEDRRSASAKSINALVASYGTPDPAESVSEAEVLVARIAENDDQRQDAGRALRGLRRPNDTGPGIEHNEPLKDTEIGTAVLLGIALKVCAEAEDRERAEESLVAALVDCIAPGDKHRVCRIGVEQRLLAVMQGRAHEVKLDASLEDHAWPEIAGIVGQQAVAFDTLLDGKEPSKEEQEAFVKRVLDETAENLPADEEKTKELEKQLRAFLAAQY